MSQSLLINPTAFEAGLEAAFASRVQANAVQRDAFSAFVKTGLPHKRMEGWRWTDFRDASQRAVPAELSNKKASNPFAPLEALEIKMTDDGFVVDQTEPGVSIKTGPAGGNFDHVADHPVGLLNRAMSETALIIEVEAGVKVARPILIRDLREQSSSFAQFELTLGAGAHATLLQSFEGASSFRSVLGRFALASESLLENFILSDSDGVSHSLNLVRSGEKSSYKSVSLSLGARLSRIETDQTFEGTGAHSTINSAALLSDDAHADFTTLVRHDAPDCVTRQAHKSVVRDQGHAVFQGKFLVNKPAQKTDANMQANAMLLSDRAQASHKPELEIYADDVECAHGSTTGSLDENALFYMRQRGLSENAARALLIEAFVAEAIDAIEDPRIVQIFKGRIQQWLGEVA